MEAFPVAPVPKPAYACNHDSSLLPSQETVGSQAFYSLQASALTEVHRVDPEFFEVGIPGRTQRIVSRGFYREQDAFSDDRY
jgi:hypothetical protein